MRPIVKYLIAVLSPLNILSPSAIKRLLRLVFSLVEPCLPPLLQVLAVCFAFVGRVNQRDGCSYRGSAQNAN